MKLSNLVHIIVMLAAMVALLGSVGYILAGVRGMFLVAGFSLIFMVMGQGASRTWMLKAIGAVRLDRGDAPGLFAIVDALVARAGIGRAPDLYLLDSEMMLGFSAGTGQNDAAIVLTGPLLQGLSAREVAGVLAHELAHIRAGDLAVMGMADMITRMTRTMSLLGIFLVIFNVPLAASAAGDGHLPWAALGLLIAAPMVNMMMQLALSRSREFEADLGAVDIAGDPAALSRALQKLERQQLSLVRAMFLPHQPGTEPSLLRSHPVTVDRVARIMAHRPAMEPLPDHLVGGHHGYPDDWSVDLSLPIRWLMRWWR